MPPIATPFADAEDALAASLVPMMASRLLPAHTSAEGETSFIGRHFEAGFTRLRNGYALNIEIKPTPGQESLTGRLVAEQAERWWAEHAASQPGQPAPAPPLLTSFRVAALAAAQAAAPSLPRGLLLHEFWDGWQEAAQSLGCAALVCHHPLWTPERIAQAHAQGWRALAYTVNQAAEAEQLLDWGLDGVITDRIDLLGP